jgi:hypothetical protein
MSVPLMGMHLIHMHLMGMPLTDESNSVHLMGVALIDVHLMSVALRRGSHVRVSHGRGFHGLVFQPPIQGLLDHSKQQFTNSITKEDRIRSKISQLQAF